MQHINSTAQYTLPNQILNDNSSSWSDLHDAAATGDEKRLQALLTSNVDRMCKESKYGNTPLHEAAWRGFSRCVKLLCTPPKIESKAKKLKKTIVETRASSLLSSILGIRNDEGFSALHLAAENGHNQSCRELLLAGADPDVQNFYGDTALHTACRYGHAGATRIILSAQCDSNKANLNGDTALHISCAMGRRKLTRILLEAGCNVLCTNAQNETPRDIATRKRYKEILEILDNPRPQKNRKKKHRDKDGVDGDRSVSPAKEVNWSPYGCHYYPDPRNFPNPKLETLPKEPLKPGEQYYLDLSGRIHKGPIGVGNTCYCGSFFRHIEDKISCNQKNLLKYVHKAKASMGQKVQALALRTNDQIEQLTRTMIEERARCESRRIYIDRCLRRGEPIRLTADFQLKGKRKQGQEEGTLMRCRSMDFLDESSPSRKVQASRSCDLLDEALVQVHRNNEGQSETTFNDDEEGAEEGEEDEDEDEDESEGDEDDADKEKDREGASYSVKRIKDLALTELSLSKMRKAIDEPDMESLTKRLGDLLAKTKLLTEKDFENEQRPDSLQQKASATEHQQEDKSDSELSNVDSLSNFNDTIKPNPKRRNPLPNPIEKPDLSPNQELDRNTCITSSDLPVSYTNEPLYHSYKPIYTSVNHLFSRRKTRSALSETSNQSQHSSTHDLPSLNDPPLAQQYLADSNELHHVLKALSKDRLNQESYAEQESLNQNEQNVGNKISYKSEQINDILNHGVLKKDMDAKEKPAQEANPNPSVRGLAANFERNMSLTQAIVHQAPEMNETYSNPGVQNAASINGRLEKLEIKNCAIKTLKTKSSTASNFRTKVQNLVERFQSSSSSKQAKAAAALPPALPPSLPPLSLEDHQDSESSEDDQNYHNERLNSHPYQYTPIQKPQPQQHLTTNHYHQEQRKQQLYQQNHPQLHSQHQNHQQLSASSSLSNFNGNHNETPTPPPTLPRNLPYLPARNVIPLTTRHAQNPNPTPHPPLLQNINQRIAYQPPPSQRLMQNYPALPERLIPKDAYFHKLPNKPKTSNNGINIHNSTTNINSIISSSNNNNNYQNASELDLNRMIAGSSAVSNATYQSIYTSEQQFRLSQLQKVQYPPTNMNLSPSGSSYTSIADQNLVNNIGLPQPIESTLYRQSPANIYRYHSNPVDHALGTSHSIPANISPMQTTPPSIERDMLSNDSGFSTRIYYES